MMALPSSSLGSSSTWNASCHVNSEVMDDELMQLVNEELQDFEALQAIIQNEHSQESPPTAAKQPTDATTRRRPRIELFRLRLEAQELEVKLERLRRKWRPLILQQLQPVTSMRAFGTTSWRQPQISHDTVEERFSQWVAHATKEWNAWKQTAQQEFVYLQHAEQVNQQLRRIVRRQVQMAHKMQRMVQKRVNGVQKRLASWIKDFETCPLAAKRSRLCSSASPTHSSFTTPQLTSQTQVIQSFSNDQAALHLLLQRAEFSFQHMDLVFQQHMVVLAPSLQNRNGEASGCALGSHDPLCASRNDPLQREKLALTTQDQLSDVSLHEDFAEMNCCTVAQFDPQTLLDLFWKCFMPKTSIQSDGVHCSPSLAASSPNRGSPPMVGSNSILEAYEKSVLDNVIHAKGHFSIVLCQTQVQIQAHIALKKYNNVLVWESMGRMEPEIKDGNSETNGSHSHNHNESSSPDSNKCTFEFARSAWCRVESIAKDKSRLHLVSRMRPIGSTNGSSSCSSNDQRDDQQAKQQHHQQLELLAELMKRCQQEISDHLHQLLVERLGQTTTTTTTPPT